MKIVDGDSHFIEPLDLYLRYIDPAYRDRAMHVGQDPTSGKQQMFVDGKRLRLGTKDIDEMLSISVSGLSALTIGINTCVTPRR